MSWEKKVQEALRRHDELTQQLADPSVIGNNAKLREVAREHSELGPLVETARQLESVRTQLADARQMISTSTDAELVELAESEIEHLTEEEERLSAELRQLLIPKDPLADRAAVVEIRAGTGGDEAGLFAGDLWRMYTRYAEKRRWKVETMDISEGERGAVKEVVFIVRGTNAFGDLRNESGVHRVQRVPATES